MISSYLFGTTEQFFLATDAALQFVVESGEEELDWYSQNDPQA